METLQTKNTDSSEIYYKDDTKEYNNNVTYVKLEPNNSTSMTNFTKSNGMLHSKTQPRLHT